jgi:hypothetical protein
MSKPTANVTDIINSLTLQIKRLGLAALPNNSMYNYFFTRDKINEVPKNNINTAAFAIV